MCDDLLADERQCGKINSLKVQTGNESASAMVEFDSKEDALVALTRDQKTLDGNTITVHLGSGATLFVTNFPPAADEAYIRDLFQKVSAMSSNGALL